MRDFCSDFQIEKWLEIAYECAKSSPDKSTQNGAIIVDPEHKYVSRGCNRLPDRVRPSPERSERPKKYEFTEHAERNAIYSAAKLGRATAGATMVCPWFACADCARGIIQSGITRVIGHQPMFDQTPPHWKDSIASAFEMLNEAGIETELYPGRLDLRFELLFNGSPWRP